MTHGLAADSLLAQHYVDSSTTTTISKAVAMLPACGGPRVRRASAAAAALTPRPTV
ncbi:hypothetical protein ACFC96_38625 [Streptomyces sp. NPDC055955]|uniref:hypothetical protein n=1 Tax=Streptomyces sp. NPDC055955 TaxID=3345665 RepID=UPI0035D612C2